MSGARREEENLYSLGDMTPAEIRRYRPRPPRPLLEQLSSFLHKHLL